MAGDLAFPQRSGFACPLRHHVRVGLQNGQLFFFFEQMQNGQLRLTRAAPRRFPFGTQNWPIWHWT
jgi:hypothetical protein